MLVAAQSNRLLEQHDNSKQGQMMFCVGGAGLLMIIIVIIVSAFMESFLYFLGLLFGGIIFTVVGFALALQGQRVELTLDGDIGRMRIVRHPFQPYRFCRPIETEEHNLADVLNVQWLITTSSKGVKSYRIGFELTGGRIVHLTSFASPSIRHEQYQRISNWFNAWAAAHRPGFVAPPLGAAIGPGGNMGAFAVAHPIGVGVGGMGVGGGMDMGMGMGGMGGVGVGGGMGVGGLGVPAVPSHSESPAMSVSLTMGTGTAAGPAPGLGLPQTSPMLAGPQQQQAQAAMMTGPGGGSQLFGVGGPYAPSYAQPIPL